MKHTASFFAAALTMLLTKGLVFAQDTTLTITSTGNVGIGTVNPDARLDVSGGNFQIDHGRHMGAGVADTFSYDGDQMGWYAFGSKPDSWFGFGNTVWIAGYGGIKLFAGGSSTQPAVAVTYNHNVGIGTTTPNARLGVRGGDIGVDEGGQNTGTTSFGIRFGGAGSTEFIGSKRDAGGNQLGLDLFTNDQNRLSILNNGNVGIGTTEPDQRLSVNGNASKVGGGSWATFSDRRVKEDVNPFSDGLSVVKGIRPVTFRYNGKLGYPTDKTYVGVIAQEIQSVAPYTVDTYRTKLDPDDAEETDILRFDGTALTYIAINAIKELDAKVEAINKLQKENQNLADRLAELETLVRSLAAERTSGGNGSLGELR